MKLLQKFIHEISKKKYYFFVLFVMLLFGFQLYLSSWLNMKGDIYYNEDVARDLLLIEDIISHHHFTLIGPRISVAGGLFHGPLWLYLNIPAYLIGQGNPLIMGIFWQLLYCCLLIITYVVGSKLFDKMVGLLSALLLSSATYFSIFNNTYGALLVFPLYFYFLNAYLKTLRSTYLLLAFFLGGVMIQFEVAFAGPILLMTLLYLTYFLAIKKKLIHLLSFFIIVIPLATYILFDLRHGFLQTHAVFNFIFGHHTTQQQHITFVNYFFNHFALIINSSLQSFTHGYTILALLMIAIFIYLLLISTRGKFANYRYIYLSFMILYGGFWILSLLYKGNMWVWYYNEFTPVLAIVFASAYRLINKYAFIAIFFLLYGLGMWSQISYIGYQSNFIGKDGYSWQLYYRIAKTVYASGPREFGYFVNEHDSLGYRTTYAMHYAQRKFQNISYENTKKSTTYLIEETRLSNMWWQKNKVRITGKPISTIAFPEYQVQKFTLNQKELAVPFDPTVETNLFFR